MSASTLSLPTQATIGVSKIVSALLGQSDSNLRRSLTSIASYVGQDEKVQVSVWAILTLILWMVHIIVMLAYMMRCHGDSSTGYTPPLSLFLTVCYSA